MVDSARFSQIDSWNRWILGLFAAGLVTLLGLIGYTFLRFPSTTTSLGTGPKANIPLWFGAMGATIAYLVLAFLIGSLYLWVALQGRRSPYSWLPGALCGLVLGGGWFCIGLISAWLPALSNVSFLTLLLVVGLPGLAGALSVYQTGQVSSGALAGFWCGLVAAVLIACSIIAVDNVFATTLIHTTWAHDHTCPMPADMTLAACEVSDDLGFVATLLVALPLLLAGVGLVGGAIGVATISPEQKSQQTAQRAVGRTGYSTNWRAPIAFSSALLLLLFVELIWHLW